MVNKSKIYWGVIALFIGFGIFKGCRPKGNDVDPTVDSTAVSGCILRSESINNVLYRTYEYDSTRTLTRMLEYAGSVPNNRLVKRYTFEYDKNKKLSRLRETNLQTQDQSYIYEPDYAGGTAIKTVRVLRIFNSGAVPNDTLQLVYNTENQRVTEMRSAKGVTSKWEYDTAANVKRWLLKLPTKQTDSVVATYGVYDSNINIYAFSQGMQLLNMLKGRAHSRHNPFDYMVLNERTDVSYQYNDKRVPMLQILKVRSGNSVIRETVYAYELDCK